MTTELGTLNLSVRLGKRQKRKLQALQERMGLGYGPIVRMLIDSAEVIPMAIGVAETQEGGSDANQAPATSFGPDQTNEQNPTPTVGSSRR